MRVLVISKRELFDFFALQQAQLADKVAFGLVKIGFNAPVFLSLECADFLFALDDQAQGRTLHATGG
jgi:hypothetical protein